MILPTVNTELFSLALREFAREAGAGKRRRILLVVNKAGWHTGGEVEIPEGIDLEFLPKGSPELMPAERLWPLTNEALANGLFEEIEEIEEALWCNVASSYSISPKSSEISPTTTGGPKKRRHEVSSIIHPDSVLIGHSSYLCPSAASASSAKLL